MGVLRRLRTLIWWTKLGPSFRVGRFSFAGRATLANSVASAMPTYHMLSSLVPKGTVEKLDSLILLWGGGTDEKRAVHLVGVCRPKKLGGLGRGYIKWSCIIEFCCRNLHGASLGSGFECKVVKTLSVSRRQGELLRLDGHIRGKGWFWLVKLWRMERSG